MLSVVVAIGAFAVSLLRPGPVRADAIHVPQDVPTIQAALDSISDGDTVLVGLGVYSEALIAPPLHFALKGDVIPDTGEFPRPVIDVASLPGADTLTCLRLYPGARALIEDMVFRHGRMGIRMQTDSVILRRCILDSSRWGFYEDMYGGSATLEFGRCIVRDHTLLGIYVLDYGIIVDSSSFLSGGGTALCLGGAGSRITASRFGGIAGLSSLAVMGSNSEVSNCSFGPSIVSSQRLLLLFQGQENTRVRDNIFTGNLVTDAVLKAVALAAGTFRIENNSWIDNASETGTAGIRVDPDRPDYHAFWGGTIRGNIFSNCFGAAGSGNALYTVEDVDVSANRFEEYAADPHDAPTIHVATTNNAILRDNLFLNTGWALRSDVSALDADSNWWGDASGPYHATQNPGGLGDTIVGNADFTPWYGDTSFLSVGDQINVPHPSSYVLCSYPNPFNPTTQIRFDLPQAALVNLTIFDVLGRKVETLLNDTRSAGSHHIVWNAENQAAGIYFARMRAGDYIRTTKLLLLK
jgi:hypothetical protein